MKLHKKILKNISIVSISTGVTSIIGLAMIPFLINHLGPEEYASYMIFNLFLVTGYAGLLFFGLPVTIIKCTAEYYEKDLIKCNNFFSTILIFTVFYGLLISIISLIIYPTILDLLLLKISYSKQNIDFILISIFASYPIFFLQLFLDATLEGLQKYSFLKTYKIFLTILNSLGIFFLLENEYSLLEIYLLQAFLSIISNIFVLCYLNKVGVNFNKCKIDKSLLNETIRLSSANFLSHISSTIFHESDRLLIAMWLPTIYFTYYEIATKIPRALKLIIGFANILLPLSSQLNSKSDSKKLQVLFCSGSKLTYCIVFPFLGAAIYLSEDILSLWVGKEFAFLAGPFNDMIIWSLLTIIITMGTNVLLGSIKYLKPVMYYSWSITILKILISISLFNYLELRAITYAYLYSNLITLPLLIFLLNNFLKIELKFYFSFIKIPIIFFASNILSNFFTFYVITTDLLYFFIKSLIFIILSFLLMFYFFLNNFERDFLKNIIRKNVAN